MFEAFLEKLMAQAGISPQQIVQAYQFVAALQRDVEGAKGAWPAVLAHFNQRFDNIDQRLSNIETVLLRIAHPHEIPQPKVNGEIHT